MPPTSIKVLCVEDNQLVAEALQRKLEGDPAFTWLGWADSQSALLERIAGQTPDVVCMDLDLPGEDTFAMIQMLKERCPAARVLILTGHVRVDHIDRAIDAGVWGYLSKAEESKVIIDSIRQVADGNFVLGTHTREVREGYSPPTVGAGGSLPAETPRPVVTTSPSLWKRMKSIISGAD